jgi:ribosomal protein S18 acetylase RimI-like enzyme
VTYLDMVADRAGVPVKVKKYDDEYKIYTPEGELVAYFKLSQIPGCCGICVSYNSGVDERFRSRGIGSILNSMRIQMAYEDGYTVLMGTTVETNGHELRILEKNGWRQISSFVNKRTRRTVLVHEVTVYDTGIEVGMILGRR